MGGGADHKGRDAAAAAVTRLLNDASAGDARATAELLPLVYEQLRGLAREKMANERPDQTLQATALVHEAYLRIVKGGEARAFTGRWHFYAAAAEAMRRILVDRARLRRSLKRGGGQQRVGLDHVGLAVAEPSEDVIALDEGLQILEAQQPEKAQLVKLRYFAGLTIEEAAEAMGISVATANRYWAYAKAWLYRHVTGAAAPSAAAGAT